MFAYERPIYEMTIQTVASVEQTLQQFHQFGSYTYAKFVRMSSAL